MKTLWFMLLGFWSLLAVADSPSFTLDKSSRTSMQITVYNHGKALVQEVRESVLPKGQLAIEYVDVPTLIEPGSVSLRGLKYPKELNLLEQHYHYELLNRDSLLRRYIGRKIKYSRSVLEGTKFEKVLREGVLLAVNPEVVQFGDEIEISPEGTISLSHIPEDLRATPALNWLVQNDRVGEKQLAVRYLTGGMRWYPEYTMVLDEEGEEFSLGAWVTIDNRSGTGFTDASISLVAGNLHQVAPPPAPGNQMFRAVQAEAMAADVASTASTFADYQLYQLPGQHDLEPEEARQIRFLDISDKQVSRRLVLANHAASYAMDGVMSHPVTIELEFLNSKRKGPGIPLPAGRVMVMQMGEDDIPRLIGEDQLDHIPVDETVNLQIGQAFDVTAERRQSYYRRPDNRTIETGYELTLKNAGNKSREVIVRERFSGDWRLLEESQTGEKVSAFVREWRVKVPGEGQASLRYGVRIRR